MTIKELKKLFKEYLTEYHSEFSSSTIASYSAMAFFAYNHDIGFSLVDAMKTDVSFNEAKDAEKKHLESLYAESDSITPYHSNNIKKYLVALDLLKEFFDNQDEKGTPICMDDGSIEGKFYEIAKKIFTEGITVNKAVAEIRKVDKNYTNATCTMYFNSFVAMVNGEAYTRSLPYKMVDVFIRNIGRDFGDEKRRNALKATLEMLNYYYKKTGQPLKEHRVVCQKIADEFGDGISFDYKTVAFESGSKLDEELENGITDETQVAFDELEGSFYKWLYEKVDNNTFSFYKSRVFMSINYYCFFNGLLNDRLFCCVEITDIKSAREYLEKDNNYKNDTVSKEDALAALNYYIEFLETHIINCSTESASDTNDDAEESIEWIEEERIVNEDESGSDTIDIENIEEAFFIWLKEQIDPRQIDSYKKVCADIEAFCKRTKLLNDSLFRCVDLKRLKIIRQQVAENKTYRFSGKVDVEKSVKAMRFYINFVEAHEFSLDESTKPTNEENKTTNNEVVFDSGLTILEAITIVLQEAEKPLTSNEIYQRIVKDDLYRFGSATPISVVSMTTKRACKDAIVSKKMAKDLFGFVKNDNGKTTYYLLTRESEFIDSEKQARDVALRGLKQALSQQKVTTTEYLSSVTSLSDKEITTLLKDVPWARFMYHRWRYDETQASNTDNNENNRDDIDQQEVFELNFISLPKLSYSKPVYLSYFDKEFSDISSWKELYLLLITELLDDYPDEINVGMSFTKTGLSQIDIGNFDMSKEMRVPKTVRNFEGKLFYIETNLNAKDIARKIKYLLNLCKVDYENVVIKYAYIKDETVNEESTANNQPDVASSDSVKIVEEGNIDSSSKESAFSYVYNRLNKLVNNYSEFENYIETIQSAQEYAEKHSIQPSRLITKNDEECLKTIKALLSDSGFLRFDKEHLKKYSTVLTKYLNLIGIDYDSYSDSNEETSEKKDAINNNVVVPCAPDESFDKSFLGWLTSEVKISESIAEKYIESIHIAEEYARQQKYTSPILRTFNNEVALATASKLSRDSGFMRLNSEHNGWLTASFQKLNRFLAYHNPEKFGLKYTQTPKEIPVEKPLSVMQPAKKESYKDSVNTLKPLVDDLLKQSTNGITREEIFDNFKDQKQSHIKMALEDCHPVIVLKKYYHRDNISDYNEMADIMLEVLNKQFAQNGNYTSAQMLYSEIQPKLDDFFFYNGAFDSKQEVYDLAIHLFEQEKYKDNSFIFVSGMHIWKKEPDYPKDYCGLLIKYAREHGNVFSREAAQDYFEKIGSTSPAATLSNVLNYYNDGLFLQFDENQYFYLKAIEINDYFLERLKTQLLALIEEEDYVSVGDIDDYFYSTLPQLTSGVYWSAWLLRDMLSTCDVGFTTIEAGDEINRKTQPAAIVRKGSSISSFGDVVFDAVSSDFELPKEFSATEFRTYLLEKGFIRGSEKMWNVHKTVDKDIRFYWTDNNSKVTINY